MANQYKGEIKGKLGDKERTFRLTFESIVNIESRTGRSIMDITHDLALTKYSMKDLVIVLHEGLTGAGGKFVQGAVGEMVIQTGLMETAKLASELLTTIFTGTNKKEDDSPLVEGENEQKDTQSSNT
jgi:hypothetical protein|tara:strand:- start:655 stop:1035 length:381 start_codon:yes stop_codon:yes gene_type:complete